MLWLEYAQVTNSTLIADFSVVKKQKKKKSCCNFKCVFFPLQILVFLFPAGMYFCFSKLSDANIFIILYGITSIYFAVSKQIIFIIYD